MKSDIFYTDKYVEVTSNYMNVNYDSHIETIYLADVQSVNLSSERSKDLLKLVCLFSGITLAMVSVLLFSIDQGGIWTWLRSVVILTSILANAFLGMALRNSTRCTLTLGTTSGPVDILTSTSGAYLSKVRRAINEALKARSAMPKLA